VARTNIYLKLDLVDGESVDEDHVNWIELDSFKWNVQNTASFATGQGGQATQGHVDKISIDKLCDKSSVTLFQNCTTGKHIKNGRIECLKLDGETRVKYLEIELIDILVAKVDWQGQGTDSVLKESVDLEFAEFRKTYTIQTDTGGKGGQKEFQYNRQTSKSN
jgi:type VI secretion system secreted protein Hcp